MRAGVSRGLRLAQRIDADFEAVIRQCANAAKRRWGSDSAAPDHEARFAPALTQTALSGRSAFFQSGMASIFFSRRRTSASRS